MKNEFDVALDRNGYAPSILNVCAKECYICFKRGYLQRHEVYHGSDRKKSKEYGLWINVCPECHYQIHNGDGSLDIKLKQESQEIAEAYYGWNHADFRKRFRKSYN